MLEGNQNHEDKIQKLLEENLEYNKAIYEMCKKTRKYILIVQIMGWVRLLLILVPIVLAIIYLPPLLQSWLGSYKELLSPNSSGSILEQLQELQESGGLKDLLK